MGSDATRVFSGSLPAGDGRLGAYIDKLGGSYQHRILDCVGQPVITLAMASSSSNVSNSKAAATMAAAAPAPAISGPMTYQPAIPAVVQAQQQQGTPYPNLLGPQDCHPSLDVTDYTSIRTVGRFCLMKAEISNRLVPVVIPHSLALPKKFLRDLKAGRIKADAQHEKPLLPSWNSAPSKVKIVDTVDLDQLVASKRVTVDGGWKPIKIDGSSILSLLNGGAAVASYKDKTGDTVPVVLSGKNSIRAKAVDNYDLQVTVSDLAQLAVNPKLKLAPRRTLNLDAVSLQELVTKGRTSKDVDGLKVLVTVPSPPLTRSEAAEESESELQPNRPGPLKLALYLPLKQEWKFRGYLRGQLVRNIPLSPEEEVVVELFSWDRRRKSATVDLSSVSERAWDASAALHDSTQVLLELTKSSGSQVQPNGSFGLDLQVVKFNLGVQANIQNQVQDVAKRTVETVRDFTSKASARLSDTRHTHIEETHEVGWEQRVTRKFRNPNLCHTLNLEFFDIIASYLVTTSSDLKKSSICVALPNPVVFDPTNRIELRKWEYILRPSLLAPELEEGFDAVRLLAAHSKLCTFVHWNCLPQDPVTKSVDETTALRSKWEAVVKAYYAVAQNSSPKKLMDTFKDDDDNRPDISEAHKFRSWLYRIAIAASAYTVYEYLQGLMPQFQLTGQAPLTLQFSDELADDLRARVQAVPDGSLDPQTLLQQQSESLRHRVVQEYEDRSDKSFKGHDFLEWVDEYSLFSLDDSGLNQAVKAFSASYDALHTVLPPVGAPEGDKDLDVRAVYSYQELAQAAEREEALVAHLASNRDHYRAVLWMARSEGDRHKDLEAYENLSSFIVPQPIGNIGPDLAFPLDEGALPEVANWMDTNVRSQQSSGPGLNVEELIELRTGQLTLDGRLGNCSVCEDYIEEIRRIDINLKDAQAEEALARANQERAEAVRRAKKVLGDNPDLENPTRTVHEFRLGIDDTSASLIRELAHEADEREPDP